jgi:hypothetical protein
VQLVNNKLKFDWVLIDGQAERHVDARDYDEAERIYHGLREETRGESLINPAQIPSATCQPGSLAEKLEPRIRQLVP